MLITAILHTECRQEVLTRQHQALATHPEWSWGCGECSYADQTGDRCQRCGWTWDPERVWESRWR